MGHAEFAFRDAERQHFERIFPLHSTLCAQFALYCQEILSAVDVPDMLAAVIDAEELPRWHRAANRSEEAIRVRPVAVQRTEQPLP